MIIKVAKKSSFLELFDFIHVLWYRQIVVKMLTKERGGFLKWIHS